MRRALLLSLLILAAAFPRAAAAQVAGPIGAPVLFTPKPDTTLTLEGRGPFRGSLEVRRDGASLTVVNSLDLDHYVMGVREVPGSWPMEALKAQAVAARTYALWEIQKGYWKQFGFDVCATVSCQVYQGATAELGERGRRWTAAVRATAGQVLLDAAGKPALTRYHSSSGGQTLANEVVYPSDGARPYLKSIDDPFDKVSPLHRWQQRFTRDDLQKILNKAIGLAGTLDDIRSNQTTRKVLIKTLGGELEISTVRLRHSVSDAAPSVVPQKYPGTRSDGEPMPFTLPSSRFDITKTDDGFLVSGRGYGHGVGMSQYGALGRAEAGHRYDDILAAYYGGLRPKPWTGQKSLRVAVVRNVGSAMISGNGPFSVVSSAQPLAASTLGGWSATPSGVRSIGVKPPAGYALPLALTGVTAPTSLLVDPPERGRNLDVSFVVPKPAQITARLVLDEEEVMRERLVAEAGERKVTFNFPPDDLPRRGNYTVELVADDGTKTLRSSVDVEIERPGMSLAKKIGIALLLVGLAVIVLRRRATIRRARRRRHVGDAVVASPATRG